MNKQFKRIGFAVLIYAATLSVWSVVRTNPTPSVEARALNPITTQVTKFNWFPGHSQSPEARQKYLESIEQRSNKLAGMKEELQRRERAAQKSTEFRRRARWKASPAWTQVVNSNWTEYQLLRAKAQQDPRGHAPCTICDGLGYMPCVMCEEHNGKCNTCLGTGHLTQAEYCPACVGTAKCYLCSGFGKMLCPFCSDGRIELDFPMPLQAPPLE